MRAAPGQGLWVSWAGCPPLAWRNSRMGTPRHRSDPLSQRPQCRGRQGAASPVSLPDASQLLRGTGAAWPGINVPSGPGNPRTPREQRLRSRRFGTGVLGSRTGAQPCQGWGRVTVQPLARVERPGDTNPSGGQVTDPNERCRPTPARPRSLLVRTNKIRSTPQRFTGVQAVKKVERIGRNPPLPSNYKTAALPLC